MIHAAKHSDTHTCTNVEAEGISVSGVQIKRCRVPHGNHVDNFYALIIYDARHVGMRNYAGDIDEREGRERMKLQVQKSHNRR